MVKKSVQSSRKTSGKQKQNARRSRAEALLMPTEPNQYGVTALIRSDISSAVSKALAPYNTIGNQNFFWRSTNDGIDLTQLNTGDGNVAYLFQFSNFPGYVDFSAVFDQYRLHAVSVNISPRSGPSFPTGSIQPRIWTAIDYDDSNTVNRAAIEQYDTCVVSPPGTGVCRAFVPRMAVAAYSGTFTSYANMKDQWIDMASTNVQHYGLKLVLESGAANQSVLQVYSVSITGFWEFRATR